ncbi:homeotic protein caudal [Euwallacea similis]|uniref:homeotic protein caudal n=1 Tax=Euwallacea similis TaxID=1736056 RepID=UPI00344DE277
MTSTYFDHPDMYRQQAVQNYNNNHMHSWYAPAAYPQGGQLNTHPAFLQQEESRQVFHHNDFVNHCGEIPLHDHFLPYNDRGMGMPHFHGGAPTNGNVEHPPTSPMGSSGSSVGSSPNRSCMNSTPPQQQVVTHVRPPPARSPFEWIKKNGYQSHPNPGKTRTKDKYRVVYTDHQRMELEKEFNLVNKYITIRRKTELAHALGLSERQVKIWFQNRRAKERKQNKKRVEEKSQIEMFIH